MKAATILAAVIAIAGTALATCDSCDNLKGFVCVVGKGGPNVHGCGTCCDTADECTQFIQAGLCG
nr:uncharacterized protein CTRU02_09708 [Colletotrichum truncatum]KAF6788390.1 hypothetical protein CTRU02_09708 [Colletotrichum truncatum]